MPHALSMSGPFYTQLVRRKALREWAATVLIGGLLGVLVFVLVDDFPLWKTVLAGGLYGLGVGTGLTFIRRVASRLPKAS